MASILGFQQSLTEEEGYLSVGRWRDAQFQVGVRDVFLRSIDISAPWNQVHYPLITSMA